MLWVATFCAIAVLAVGDHTRGDSATIDEPFHLYAAAEAVMHGIVATNPEHPPLAKDLAGWSLLRAELVPPPVTEPAPMPPFEAQHAFLHSNRVPFATILALGRAPFRWLLAALVIVVYVAARASGGIRAALLASAVIALEPNLLAHAGIVHTDVAAALLMTATTVLAIAAALRGSRVLWLFAGVALGLAIAAKFSALLLVPLVVLAPLLGRRPSSQQWRQQFAAAILACVAAAAVVYTVYAINTRHMHPDDAAVAVARFLESRNAPPETVGRLAKLAQRSPEVGLFLAGIEGVRLVSEHGQSLNYLHGRTSPRGFPHYFLVAFLVKSTPAVLLLALAALVSLRTKWGLGLLAPAFVLFLVSIPTALNIGVRHILPVYPLLAIAGATALATRLPRRFFAIAAALLIASAALSLRSIHPYELGYFNAFAGGPERGAEWLSDSNIDWGQDLGRLRAFLHSRGWERDTTVAVFAAGFHHDPELQGLRTFDGSIRPGRYAVSAHMANVDAGVAPLMEALRARGRRVARVGASITIWELR